MSNVENWENYDPSSFKYNKVWKFLGQVEVYATRIIMKMKVLERITNPYKFNTWCVLKFN
jgi:hypothetical protein